MRVIWIALLACTTGVAMAQDAAQQAVDIQQQIQVQQITQAQQQAALSMQQIDEANRASLAGFQPGLATPRFHTRPGTSSSQMLVEISDRSRGASIFFTRDGWTPTPASERYLGPVALGDGQTLQAIAVAPGGLRSHVATLPLVTTKGAPVSDAALHLSALTPGTSLPVLFTAPVTSRGLRVGDRLPLALATDVFVHDVLAVPRGTPVSAIVTHVDNAHTYGLPAVLSFEIQSVTLANGTTVPLSGVETLEGEDHTQKAIWTSVVPLAGLAVHGGDAEIAAGARCMAQVAGAGQTRP